MRSRLRAGTTILLYMLLDKKKGIMASPDLRSGQRLYLMVGGAAKSHYKDRNRERAIFLHRFEMTMRIQIATI